MKVIVTGPTGYIGQEILSQCLTHPGITSVVALSRRDLGITNNKLRVHLMKDQDFLTYSDPTLTEALKGAGACLWALGIRPSHASDEQHNRRVCIDYTAAAASAFQRAFAPGSASSNSGKDGRFRFVYISGAGVERDQKKSLWFAGNFRRLRGEVENVLFRHAQANSNVFETYIMRPGLVPSTQGTIGDRIWSLAPSVRVDILARAMIDVALQGNNETTLSNQTLREWGTGK